MLPQPHPSTQPADSINSLMKDENAEKKWTTLLDTARKSGGAVPEPTAETAPPATLLSHLPALREAVALMARTLLWRRFSWLAALLAALLFAAVWILLNQTDDDTETGVQPLIEPPAKLLSPLEP